MIGRADIDQQANQHWLAVRLLRNEGHRRRQHHVGDRGKFLRAASMKPRITSRVPGMITDSDPLAHDGLTVLREACRLFGTSDLSGCTFYGTAEPCPMCSAALLQTKMGRIMLGANGSVLADLLGPRAFLIEDLAVDYAVRPQVERGLESDAGLAILARSLTDRSSEQ